MPQPGARPALKTGVETDVQSQSSASRTGCQRCGYEVHRQFTSQLYWLLTQASKCRQGWTARTFLREGSAGLYPIPRPETGTRPRYAFHTSLR